MNKGIHSSIEHARGATAATRLRAQGRSATHAGGGRRPEWIFAGLVMLAAASYVVGIAAWHGARILRTQAALVPVSASVQDVSVSTLDGAGGRAARYLPRVVFRYTVDGVGYEAEHRPSPGGVQGGSGWDSADAARAAVAAYRAGGEAQAFIDPAVPAAAVLERRKPRWAALAWGVPVAMLGLCAMVFGFRRRPAWALVR